MTTRDSKTGKGEFQDKPVVWVEKVKDFEST